MLKSRYNGFLNMLVLLTLKVRPGACSLACRGSWKSRLLLPLATLVSSTCSSGSGPVNFMSSTRSSSACRWEHLSWGNWGCVCKYVQFTVAYGKQKGASELLSVVSYSMVTLGLLIIASVMNSGSGTRQIQ